MGGSALADHPCALQLPGPSLSFHLHDTEVKVTCHLSSYLFDPLIVKGEETVSLARPLSQLYHQLDLSILVLGNPGLLFFNLTNIG